MSRFAETLNTINDRLDLSHPARSRVLLEIAADLEDLYRHFRDQGLSEVEASRRAEEHCDLSDEALAQLVGVHGSPYRRFLDRLGAQARSRWERAVLAILLLLVGTSTGRALAGSDLFNAAGPFVWPALACTSIAVSIGLMKLYAVYLRQDHRPSRLRRGLDALPALAAADIVIGVYGYSWTFYVLLRAMAEDPVHALPRLTGSLLTGSATVVVCLLSAVLCALLWYIVESRVTGIEEAEASLLLVQ